MRVILINPAQEESSDNMLYKAISPVALPLGLAYLAAVLEKHNIKVSIIDQYANGMNNNEIVETIKTLEPRLVGISCLTPAMGNIIRLIGKIRNLKKEIDIVLGNTHATVFAEQILKQGWADFVVRGEGEFSFLELVCALKDIKSFEDIKGVSFLKNGEVRHNPERPLCENLDTLPYPAYHLFNLKHYSECPMLGIDNVFLPVQASRGCPYRCTFCSQDKIFRKFRIRDVYKVIDEIESMHHKFNVNCFVFEDASFPFSVDFGNKFCDVFMKRGLHKKIKWVTEMRVDLVNFELLKKMREAGLHLLLYGFEFGNQRILDVTQKGITLEQSYKAMKWSKKAHVNTFGLFMLGMPEESRQTCLDTIKFAKELNCDLAKFNIFIPLPGSDIFNQYKDKIKGISSFETFSSWSDWANNRVGKLPFIPEGMTERELFNLQKKAMFEFYFRPSKAISLLRKRLVPFRKLLLGGGLLICQCSHYIVYNIINRNILRLVNFAACRK